MKDMKKCIVCNTKKRNIETVFEVNKNHTDGLAIVCRRCVRAIRNERLSKSSN